MNKKIILKQRPVGEPKLDDFETISSELGIRPNHEFGGEGGE